MLGSEWGFYPIRGNNLRGSDSLWVDRSQPYLR